MNYIRFISFLFLLSVLASCSATVRYTSEDGTAAEPAGPSYTSEEPEEYGEGEYYQSGIASYYADKFHGRLTSCGEVYDHSKMTAAHPKLPFGTLVRVVRKSTGESVVVRINDRGPFVKGRVIDLSKAAAREIGIIGAGLAQVEIFIISYPE